MKISGETWAFGDNVDTDQIIGTQYLILPIHEMKKHTFEIVLEDFSKNVKAGDLIVGGKNFGCGSSREQAPLVLKELGIRCIIAEGFARIFYRNCINIGLPVIQINEISKKIIAKDRLEIDFEKGRLIKCSNDESYEFKAIPTFLMEIINSGGLIDYSQQ